MNERQREIYYDTHLLGVTREVHDVFPSLHCFVDLSASEDAPWQEEIDEYMRITRKIHQSQLDGEPERGGDLTSEEEEYLNTFGQHLWYYKILEGGAISKIRPPLFGVDDYVRISYYPTRVDYDRGKLQHMLEVRVGLLTEALAGDATALSAEQKKKHMRYVAYCDDLLTRTSTDADLQQIVQEFFSRMFSLGSPLPLFSDRAFVRNLDQTCALD